jgi:Lysylphosphatidylglycerol synthase TM region
MNDNSQPQQEVSQNKFSRLKTIAIIFTCFGVLLFAYFIYSVGFSEIVEGIGKIGIVGFALIVFINLLRFVVRSIAWKLSIAEPHKLRYRDTFEGVLIGEAVSSFIPLGIVASGTSKAVAISNRVPFVVGLSSVATENLFYSLITSLFIISGAFVFLVNVELEYYWLYIIYAIIAVLFLVIILGILMVFREWRWLSFLCDWVHKKGFFPRIFENGRAEVHKFEDNILNFYRQHPNRFLPIIVCQILNHVIGITEVLFILSKISETIPTFYSAFLLESVSRVVTITFKLIPFAVGVDEASSQFITENLSLGVATGVTIAILRKARILFWALVGMLLILKRGLSLSHIASKIRNSN